MTETWIITGFIISAAIGCLSGLIIMYRYMRNKVSEDDIKRIEALKTRNETLADNLRRSHDANKILLFQLNDEIEHGKLLERAGEE